MAHFCWIFKLLFLFLMMAARAPTINTRPARGISPHSDLIAGNEFLKLFLERDELHRELHSSEFRGRGGGGGGGGGSIQRSELPDADIVDNFAVDPEELVSTTNTASQRLRGNNGNSNEAADDSRQVKLVTSGSKIVFLEEYDDNDAVVDAVAREIDLQKEKTMTTTTLKYHHQQKLQQQQEEQKHYQRKFQPSDEVKVVAVSVSSSSKRSSPTQERPAIESSTQGNKHAERSANAAKHAALMHIDRRQQQQKQRHNTESHDTHFRTTSSTSKPTSATTAPARVTLTTTMTTTTTTTSTTVPATTAADFINRSHKSEFSIEEAEPLTMMQHKARSVYARATLASATMLDDEADSENSASTNIQNVLAAPLDQTGAAAAYHSSSSSTSRNFTTRTQSHINQTPSPSLSLHAHDSDDGVVSTDSDDADGIANTSARPSEGGEDKLLPFQTVIYHDTKQGHGGGPQSRSISYSSLSQNVEDLRGWQQSGGILAEAQRNVSESLKPIARPPPAHTSEPAKFYSVPAKMYGEPAKFYSEPAKIYSEPAKIYGQPEKFYSEPAKNYGQPSKFYSEPAKVYSQPSKVYGEPAKTYWPHAASTSSTTTTTPTTTAKPVTTTTAQPATIRPNSSSSRRPAIVSRIAFGEAQSSTTSAPPVPTKFGQRERTSSSTPTAASNAFHQRGQHHSQANSQPRRVLFNLDKLPYDLLNAPEQSAKHLLEPDFLRSPPASVTYASSTRQRSCLDAALSSSLSTSQHQQQPQQRQHSSLSDQHSNQNAKGLPNRDLVKCVSKYSPHSSAPTAGGVVSSQSHFTTTERSHNVEDLYTPTPEQNYEIEESVSVMTNGRAHGVHDVGAGIGLAIATTTPIPTTKPTYRRNRFNGAVLGGRRQYANSNANANVADSQDDTGGGGGVDVGTADQHHNNNDNNYDDDSNNNNNEDDAADSEDDVNDEGRAKSQGGDDDEDDSKVAYVVEGRNYRKYRVEEKTDDGFIVGEYGVVDHNDGNLRGVRYTADSTINRSLIQKALLTFLKLK